MNNEGHFIDDPLMVVSAKPDFSNIGLEPIQVRWVISERTSYFDDDITTFDIIGIWPTFEKALEYLRDIKRSQDAIYAHVHEGPTMEVEIEDNTARWYYRDFSFDNEYLIEPVNYYKYANPPSD